MPRTHPLRLRLAIVAAMAVLMLAVPAARAAVTTELLVSDPRVGTALYGFDPVTYFIDREARPGSAQFELAFGGLTWRFRSEANRAAFAARPDAFLPRFGGYDPLAVARGAPVPGVPTIFVIEDGRLFLFGDRESRATFLASIDRSIRAADASWPSVRRSLVP